MPDQAREVLMLRPKIIWGAAMAIAALLGWTDGTLAAGPGGGHGAGGQGARIGGPPANVGKPADVGSRIETDDQSPASGSQRSNKGGTLRGLDRAKEVANPNGFKGLDKAATEGNRE